MQENNSGKLKGRRNDYIKAFDTEEGKRVLSDLEKACLYNDSTFSTDALTMAYQEGIRSVYLYIIKIMKMDIEELERITNATTTNTQSGEQAQHAF